MLSLVVFISTVILVYFGVQVYLAAWLLRSFPALPSSPLALRCAALAVAISFPMASIWLRRAGPGVEAFAYAAYLWVGVSFIWFVCAILGDCFVLISRGKAPAAGWAVLTAAGTLSLFALWSASRPPALKEIEIQVPRLDKALDGFSIIQLSDLHLGVSSPVSRFEDIAERASRLKPDLVVLTGDLLDPGYIDSEAVERIGRLLDAKHGKLAVLGNHEFYHGLEAAIRCYGRCGIRLLRNEVVELPGGLQVAGVDDLMAAHISREDVSALLSKLDPKKPSVFLSHQSWMFDLAAAKGVRLMLSGHTHRGQIFPFRLFVRLFYRYVYGLYRRGGSFLYVTSGAGQWGPPMRLFAPAEIVRIVLRPG
ncbi:MAG: metallophosphoesterase [Elusimicrobia bacterium]|nr:metallophosphoesterase [Elusimicrobiota bacterium]